MIARFTKDPPYAYIIPREQRDRPTAAMLVEKLLIDGIEVHQATHEFTANRATYKEGDWVVLMDQPFAALVKELFDVQKYPELPHPPPVTAAGPGGGGGGGGGGGAQLPAAARSPGCAAAPRLRRARGGRRTRRCRRRSGEARRRALRRRSGAAGAPAPPRARRRQRNCPTT